MITTISNAGAPIIIANLENYANWLPMAKSSTKIRVICKGDMTDFSKYVIPEKTIGIFEKKFASLEEAEAFEQDVIKEFTEIHPGIERHPFYKGAPIFYKNDKRLFSIEKEYDTYYSKMCKKLQGFHDIRLISFMPKKTAIFMDSAGGGAVYIYFDRKNQSFIVLQTLTEMSAEEALAIFQSEQKKLQTFSIILNNSVIAADSAFPLSSFRNIKGKDQNEKGNFVKQELSLKGNLDLLAEGNAGASGIAFPISHKQYCCFTRYINVAEY